MTAESKARKPPEHIPACPECPPCEAVGACVLSLPRLVQGKLLRD